MTGASSQPRQNGWLLPNNVLQPQRLFRQQQKGIGRDHRESALVSHFRRAKHAEQYFTLRLARCRSVQRFLPSSQIVQLQAIGFDVHLLPRLSTWQVGYGHRLWTTRTDWQVQETLTEYIEKNQPLDLTNNKFRLVNSKKEFQQQADILS